MNTFRVVIALIVLPVLRVPGKVGLWTKADAQTRFDQFIVTALKK